MSDQTVLFYIIFKHFIHVNIVLKGLIKGVYSTVKHAKHSLETNSGLVLKIISIKLLGKRKLCECSIRIFNFEMNAEESIYIF